MKIAASLLVLCLACGSERVPASAPVDASRPMQVPGGPECQAVAAMRPPEFFALPFFETITFASEVFYDAPSSIENLADRSERVFVGRLSGVEEGNLYSNDGSMMGGVRCARGVRHTTNLVFQVLRDVRGSGTATVKVEWSHSRLVFLSDLVNKIPDWPMIVFANGFRRYPLPSGGPPDAFDDDFSYFETPLGLLADDGRRLVFPLEHHDERWLPLRGSSVAEVADALRTP